MTEKEKRLYNKLLEKLTEKNFFVFIDNNNELKEKTDDTIKISPILKELEEVNLSENIPLYCPKCGKIMNTEIDIRSYKRFNMCHVCWAKFETELRINNKYDDYIKEINKRNIDEFLLNLRNEIEDYINNLNKKHGQVTSTNGYILNFNGQYDKEKIEKELWQKYNELKEKLYNNIDKFKY